MTERMVERIRAVVLVMESALYTHTHSINIAIDIHKIVY